MDGNAIPARSARAGAARVVDALYGGRQRGDASALLAEEIQRTSPLLATGLCSGRGFVQRQVITLAEAGWSQFVDIGCGLPGAVQVHQLAARHCPATTTRTVYADIDPTVVERMRGTIHVGDLAGALAGDVRDPARVLDSGWVDVSRPVVLILSQVLAFVFDHDQPGRLLREWMSRLPSGSRLVLSHLCPGEPDAEAAAAQTAAARFTQVTGVPLRLRSREEIASWLAEWMLEPPGLAPVSAWRPPWMHGLPVALLGAVAHVGSRS